MIFSVDIEARMKDWIVPGKFVAVIINKGHFCYDCDPTKKTVAVFALSPNIVADCIKKEFCNICGQNKFRFVYADDVDSSFYFSF